MLKEVESVEQRPESEEGWKKREAVLSGLYSTTTKEKKVCKKCSHVNSFFKIDCQKCKLKFTKTRADRGAGPLVDERSNANSLNPLNTSSMNTDNYSVIFWELLQANNDYFGQNLASQISEHLNDEDFMCVRDLYKRIKEILS